MKQLSLWDVRPARTEKTCGYCGVSKPLSEFGKMTASADGHQARCRECNADYKREWYALNASRERAKMRKRNQENKDLVKQRNRQYNENHPERYAATQAVRKAVDAGYLPSISKCWCNRCGKRATEYHHADYAKPLEVEPLCRSCHKREHSGLLEER